MLRLDPGFDVGMAPPAGMPGPAEAAFLTPYLVRPHDHELDRLLTPALDGSVSAFVVLTGDSSTGKTRALYEALLRLVPARPLWRPTNAAALADLLNTGRLTPGAVLWLNEAQRFLYGERSEEAAAALRELLMTRTGVIVVGTLWTFPYWADLTRPAVDADPHSHVRALLESPVTHRVPVPADLTTAEHSAWKDLADSSGDPRMGQAVRIGAADGQVIQHLSGGPALLDAYRRGPGAHFTHAEHALVAAAIAARHLGHFAPLSEELLARIADSALPPHHRPAEPDWAGDTLLALTTGVRADGSRTDIRCTLTALTALRDTSGGRTTYEPADYLHQNLAATGEVPAPTPALWEALTACTTDLHSLVRLSHEAQRRDFRKQAVLLLCRTAASGYLQWIALLLLVPRDDDSRKSMALWMADHIGFDSLLTARLRLAEFDGEGPDVTARFAARVVSRADLTDADVVEKLFGMLRELGHEKLLMDLDPVERVRLPAPRGAFTFLVRLVDAGCTDHAVRLADRILHLDLPLRDPMAMAGLLQVLRVCEHLPETAKVLSREAAEQADLSDSGLALDLVQELQDGGHAEPACLLAHRIADVVEPEDTEGVASVLYEMSALGMGSAARRLAERAVPRVALEDPDAVAWLLSELGSCGLGDWVDALLARDPLTEVVIGPVRKVTLLLWTLTALDRADLARRLVARSLPEIELDDAEFTAGFFDTLALLHGPPATARFAQRAVEEVPLSHIAGLRFLARSLRDHHQLDALERLAGRAVAATGPDTSTFPDLLRVLREQGLDTCARAMIDQAVSHPGLDEAVTDTGLLRSLRMAGEAEAASRLEAAAQSMFQKAASEAEPPRAEPRSRAPYGLETDGTSAPAWTWLDLDHPRPTPPAAQTLAPVRSDD
ncbi:hypothetical protein [Streptomyces sp. SPB4]|uniref:hypothetical protein n=1 Tax=Streptomyces sp. SPB4 TaxID=2940553 RepID=UPI0024759236|nr:hypothetical protein [Streptomyces sp. SPB4]MDH6544223.1 hypothetical protein [Streptomyces sp. SPB4]